jgi:hypothetical protein
MKSTAITLTTREWQIVMAALLCLRDHDDARGAEERVLDNKDLRRKITRVLEKIVLKG